MNDLFERARKYVGICHLKLNIAQINFTPDYMKHI